MTKQRDDEIPIGPQEELNSSTFFSTEDCRRCNESTHQEIPPMADGSITPADPCSDCALRDQSSNSVHQTFHVHLSLDVISSVEKLAGLLKRTYDNVGTTYGKKWRVWRIIIMGLVIYAIFAGVCSIFGLHPGHAIKLLFKLF